MHFVGGLRLGKTPLIQLSDRFKCNDQFWFSFFHEVCHILEHGSRTVFLEAVEGATNNEAKEKAANDFAADFLIPPDLYREFTHDRTFFNEAMIEAFAKRICMHPGIVVGRMLHDGVLMPQTLNNLKIRINIYKAYYEVT